MKKDVYAFWEWVQQRMDELDIPSFRELERRAGASNGSITARRKDLKFPTVEMAEGLCQALRISWVDLWERAGFVDPLTLDQLSGLDAEIVRLLENRDEGLKQAVLDTCNLDMVSL